MQKDDSVPSAGTGADSEQKVENLQSSSHDTKPLVVGSPSLSDPKFPSIKDVTGKTFSHNEIVELYKKVTVAPLIRGLAKKLRPQLDDFEKSTGLVVALSPILSWDQAYQEGCELIHKSLHLSEDACSLV